MSPRPAATGRCMSPTAGSMAGLRRRCTYSLTSTDHAGGILKQELMWAARLHGIKDLQLEELPVPQPGPGELLVRVEACGICPTDARKYSIGVSDGEYPVNPGHEWVGLVEETGPDAGGWTPGDR